MSNFLFPWPGHKPSLQSRTWTWGKEMWNIAGTTGEENPSIEVSRMDFGQTSLYSLLIGTGKISERSELFGNGAVHRLTLSSLGHLTFYITWLTAWQGVKMAALPTSYSHTLVPISQQQVTASVYRNSYHCCTPPSIHISHRSRKTQYFTVSVQRLLEHPVYNVNDSQAHSIRL
jgi:hypothetical protein